MPRVQPARNTGPAREGLLERPLSARSVMASLLLGMHPPRMRGALLVRWCSQLAISEGTARVALSRMVARGELRATDGVYELAGALRDRQATQEWSLHPELRPWRDDWRLAEVNGAARAAAARQRLRDAMRRLRMAELREGVWVRPDNLPPEAASAEARAIADAQCRWWRARPDGDSVGLARELFGTGAWAARGREVTARLARSTARLLRGDEDAIAEAFVVGAASLAHVRADPLLPRELLPARWPGDRLRAAYDEYRDAFGAATAAWFARHAASA